MLWTSSNNRLQFVSINEKTFVKDPVSSDLGKPNIEKSTIMIIEMVSRALPLESWA